MIVSEKYDRRDRAGTGDGGKGQGKHRNVATGLRGSLFGRHARSEDHLEPEQKQDDASCELERQKTNAEVSEKNLTSDEECEEDRSGHEHGFAGDRSPLSHGQRSGQRHEESYCTDRIDGDQQHEEIAHSLPEHSVTLPQDVSPAGDRRMWPPHEQEPR